jgi:hypothetical protein
VTVTFVAVRVKDWLLLEDAETLMVRVPEEAVLTEGFDGVKFATMVCEPAVVGV